MEITEVKVFPIQEEKLKAFVSIVFEHCFMVNDIKIIQGRDGLFISMPSRKKKNGEFKDVAHPLNNETRRMIEDRVLGEYGRILGERGEALPVPHATVHPAAAPAGTPASILPAVASASPVAAVSFDGAAPVDGAAPPARAAHPEHAHTANPANPVHPAIIGSLPPGGTPPAVAGGAGEKTLEEIEEMHLRDSFWTT